MAGFDLSKDFPGECMSVRINDTFILSNQSGLEGGAIKQAEGGLATKGPLPSK